MRKTFAFLLAAAVLVSSCCQDKTHRVRHVIFLGGSIAEAFPYFEASMKERLSQFPYKKVIEQIKVYAANSPDHILTGAAV